MSGQKLIKNAKKWWKMPKLKFSNATFLVIFKHCARSELHWGGGEEEIKIIIKSKSKKSRIFVLLMNTMF